MRRVFNMSPAHAPMIDVVCVLADPSGLLKIVRKMLLPTKSLAQSKIRTLLPRNAHRTHPPIVKRTPHLRLSSARNALLLAVIYVTMLVPIAPFLIASSLMLPPRSLSFVTAVAPHSTRTVLLMVASVCVITSYIQQQWEPFPVRCSRSGWFLS